MDLIEALIDAQQMIATALAELKRDPSLADNPHWRDHLEGTGYMISTLLSTEDD
jgi:hypothetical protein